MNTATMSVMIGIAKRRRTVEPASMIRVVSVSSGLRARRGIAPLELVMVLPLLAGLFYAMFSIVKTTLTRMDAVEAARFETWKKLPETTTTRQLILNSPRNDGQSEERAVRSVRLDGWWGGSYSPESSNRTLAGTWDHTVVPFDAGQPPFLAHVKPVSLIADQAKLGGVSAGMLKTFALFMNLPKNPAVRALGAVSHFTMPIVRIAGIILRTLKPVLAVTRAAVAVARAVALATFQFRLARFLGRVMRLLSLGMDAFQELYDVSNPEQEVDWPKGGLQVGGAFP